ncbi:tRNA (cytidine(34)-2'-O)-methyltransferase [Rappaport israeli]|uniref:tRNA (cytidine(34)-2'-O)-methyltransferase n=1 Tax=Rappaport israeli TaxID=1839807 RepID=UPI00092FE1B8
MHIALFQPQIPPNTGNIIRLCANTGAQLHLIHPLGFTWDNKRLRRAGLDYQEFAHIHHHPDWQSFYHSTRQHRIWAFTTKSQQSLYSAKFSTNDLLLFGSETHGLNAEIHQTLSQEQTLRLPMRPNSRSLNLSNSVAIATYELIRQTTPNTAILL